MAVYLPYATTRVLLNRIFMQFDAGGILMQFNVDLNRTVTG
jgi:hypothetical protein